MNATDSTNLHPTDQPQFSPADYPSSDGGRQVLPDVEMLSGKPRRGPRTARARLGYMRISGHGTVTDRSSGVVFPRSGGGQRGAVQGFTPASARRLRRLLVEWTGPAESKWNFGFTLTVPGPLITGAEWRRMWDAYRHRINRLGVTVVWRIELQRRMQPHVHLVAWGPQHTSYDVGSEWREVLKLLGPCEHKGESYRDRVQIPGAYDHAVLMSEPFYDRDSFGWYRYLAAHASKSKQDQLGWRGRQWGVIGRSRLRPTEALSVKLSDRELCKVIRYLKRLSGCRRAHGRGVQTWFVREGVVLRLCAWAVSERGSVK